MTRFVSDHVRIDERSLALHTLIAGKLLADSTILDRARSNIRRWQAQNGAPFLAFTELERILESNPVESIAALLVERSENATRLRQSSPFTGILTEDERRSVYESYNARAYHSRGEPDLGVRRKSS